MTSDRPQHIFRVDPRERVETGGIQFEYDHPGYFIRGDDCFKLLVHIGTILRDAHKLSEETQSVLSRLLKNPDFALGRHLERIRDEVIGRHRAPPR